MLQRRSHAHRMSCLPEELLAAEALSACGGDPRAATDLLLRRAHERQGALSVTPFTIAPCALDWPCPEKRAVGCIWHTPLGRAALGLAAAGRATVLAWSRENATPCASTGGFTPNVAEMSKISRHTFILFSRFGTANAARVCRVWVWAVPRLRALQCDERMCWQQTMPWWLHEPSTIAVVLAAEQ